MGATGRFRTCTNSTRTKSFLRHAFEPTSGDLRVPTPSPLWDAVTAAHQAGRTGAGARIGVADTGFDLRHPALVSRVEWLAQPGRRSRGHGTAVAGIIRSIAPDAIIIVDEVAVGSYIHGDDVARSLDRFTTTCDVVNLSLGEVSDARMLDPATDVDLDDLRSILDPSTSTEESLRAMDRLASRLHMFPDGRCESACRLCDAIDRGAETGLALIAAAGNANELVHCPAVHARVVGVGFGKIEQRLDDATLVDHHAPTPHAQSPIEARLPWPPGFHATSFAAPILTGLLALDHAFDDLGAIVQVSDLQALVQSRHGRLVRFLEEMGAEAAREITAAPWLSILEMLEHLVERLPESHHHWRRHDAPCATCAVLVGDVYRTCTQVAIAARNHEAAETWSAANVRLCPASFDGLLNRGWAQYKMAAHSTSPAVAERLRTLSTTNYRAAMDRRPDQRVAVRAMVRALHANT